jgi:hypothetical protein
LLQGEQQRSALIPRMNAAAGVYILQGDDTLVEMAEAAYDSEAVLQDLLTRYPSIQARGRSGVPSLMEYMLYQGVADQG